MFGRPWRREQYKFITFVRRRRKWTFSALSGHRLMENNFFKFPPNNLPLSTFFYLFSLTASVELIGGLLVLHVQHSGTVWFVLTAPIIWSGFHKKDQFKKFSIIPIAHIEQLAIRAIAIFRVVPNFFEMFLYIRPDLLSQFWEERSDWDDADNCMETRLKIV